MIALAVLAVALMKSPLPMTNLSVLEMWVSLALMVRLLYMVLLAPGVPPLGTNRTLI